MKRAFLKTCLLFAIMVGIAATAFAVTDEINRVAEQADKLYVAERYSEAFPLMKRAAEGGDVISMFNLGTMYYHGQGTTKNISEARRWWQDAANQGDDLAREMLNRLDAKQAASRPRTNQTFTVNGVSFTMVYVEGGTFTMGAKPEQAKGFFEAPAHEVTLSSFCIGQTEVTQALWQAVMGSNPSWFKGDLNRPVEMVSWDDCQSFITKLNELTGQKFRLPTEAEWEYSARGGNYSKSYNYSGNNKLDKVAWYKDNSNYQTHPVATKKPNELKLYDMSGNVEEWCNDWFGGYRIDSQTNPMGPSTIQSNRVNRGGGWESVNNSCRVLSRDYLTPISFYNYLGLRIAL